MRWQTRARSLRLRSMTRAAFFAIAAAIALPAAAQTLPAGLTTPVVDDVAALHDAALKDDDEWDNIGRAHVCTTSTNAHRGTHLPLEKKTLITVTHKKLNSTTNQNHK